jgi:hypothetical protein
MNQIQVKEIMLDVSACPSVNEEDSLLHAIKTLSEAASESANTRYPLQTLLVKDSQGLIVGELTFGQILTGLEPGYRNLGDLSRISYSGLTPEVLTMIRDTYGLWQRPLAELCEKSSRVKIAGILDRAPKRQFIDVSMTLNEATHRLITIEKDALLVMDEDRVVGLLRICDVFTAVGKQAERCDV